MFSTVSVRRTTFRLSNRDEVRDVVAHRTPNRLYGVCIVTRYIAIYNGKLESTLDSRHERRREGQI